MTKKKAYDDDSIVVLATDRIKIRKRPTNFIPNTGGEGVIHIYEEGIDNGIDELTTEECQGKQLTVIYDVNKMEISIIDDGRGIPLGKLETIFTKINSSSKFDNDDNSSYQHSGGTNGVGAKLENYLSDYLKATSMREGKMRTVHFEDGLLVKDELGKSKKSGSVVTFRLSDRFLDVKAVSAKDIQNRLKEKSFIFPNLKMTFISIKDGHEVVNKTYTGKDIMDLIQHKKPSTDVIRITKKMKTQILDRDAVTLLDKKCSVDLVLGFSDEAIDINDVLASNVTYGNTIRTTLGGTHLEGLKDGVIKFFKEELPNRMTKKELESLNVTNNDIVSGLISVVWVGTNTPQYRAQHKDMINNPEIRTMVREAVYEGLKEAKDGQIKKMCEFIKDVIKGRLAAKNVKVKKKNVDNAFSKDRINSYVPFISSIESTNTELIIIEGVSAEGACVNARDRHNQALYSMTGRPDNVLDSSIAEISKMSTAFNEIMDICGLQIGKNFDIADMAFDRISIASDGDTDKICS